MYIEIRRFISEKTLAFVEGTSFSFLRVTTCVMTGASVKQSDVRTEVTLRMKGHIFIDVF